MKKGFTLIELLAVIAILAIIMIVATPKILDVIEESRVKAYKNDKEVIIKATELYLSNHAELLPSNLSDTIEISLNDLKAEELLENIKSPFNSNNCEGYILVTKIDNDKYDYSPEFNCIDNTKNSSLTDGLVGYWKFDENVYDYFGDSEGTITGANYTEDRFGANKAIFFDGVDDYVDTGLDYSWNNTNQVSISLWIKPSAIEYNIGLIGKSYPLFEWNLYQHGLKVGMVYWDVDGNHTNSLSFTTGDVLEINKWSHIVYTWDNVNEISRIYVDGKLEATDYATSTEVNKDRDNSILIGGHIYSWGDSYYEGAIDEVRLYSRLLIQEEIEVLYKSTK